jgi:hypothetical protein
MEGREPTAPCKDFPSESIVFPVLIGRKSVAGWLAPEQAAELKRPKFTQVRYELTETTCVYRYVEPKAETVEETR